MSPGEQSPKPVDEVKGLRDLVDDFNRLYDMGEFSSALRAVEEASKLSDDSRLVCGQSRCLLRLGRSQEAYDCLVDIKPPRHDLVFLDLMTEICSAVGRPDDVRAYGSMALACRDSEVADQPRYALPSPSPDDRPDKNSIIAYSLFGAHPRYCEVGIMNCTAAAQFYPQWRCRFYCDESVPDDVCRRIVEADGEVFKVDSATRATIPPLMWRFLVADDPDVSRFLVRDTDSIMGAREAAAVNAWIASGKWFHVMRDYWSHAEIMLAGMWGGCVGAIPDMRQEILAFVKATDFEDSHVDQRFLRQRIWPTARQSVLSHDSHFIFFNNEPLPDVRSETLYSNDHIGANISTSVIEGNINIPDGTTTIYIVNNNNIIICKYPIEVKNQEWNFFISKEYAQKIQNGEWTIKFRN